MNKQCIICSNAGIYKCPTCLIFYCSATCCKKHRENDCDVLKKPDIEDSENSEGTSGKTVVNSEIHSDEVPSEKLSKLGSNEELKNLLQNPHLQNLLMTVDKAENADEIMQKAMQEPLFVEFADTCLKVVEPEMITQPDDTPMT